MHDRNENLFDTNMLEANVNLKVKILATSTTKDSYLWNLLYNINSIIPILW